jgi:hypothetical protein
MLGGREAGAGAGGAEPEQPAARAVSSSKHEAWRSVRTVRSLPHQRGLYLRHQHGRNVNASTPITNHRAAKISR